MSSTTQLATRDEYTDLTGFQRDLLWQLFHLDGAYGGRLKQSLEEMGYEEVNHSRMYQNIDSLVRSDLIEKSDLDGRTKEYSLTDEAKKLLADRQSWERGES
jgi:DNA-binding PadR family transcriptional regulator